MNAEAQKEEEFDFEIEEEQEVAEQEEQVEPEQEEPELEIEDDTPEEDRGHSPMPKEIVEELEADELEDYSDKVKQRLKQMKKVWHDERREKEKAFREQQEAIRVAQQALEENKRLKANMSRNEETLVNTYKQAAELELKNAERAYKEAHELGDTDQMLDAGRVETRPKDADLEDVPLVPLLRDCAETVCLRYRVDPQTVRPGRGEDH